MADDMERVLGQINRLLLDRDNNSSQEIVKIANEDSLRRLRQYALPTDEPKTVESVSREAEDIYSHRVHMDHPKFFGFIPSPVSSLGITANFLEALYNTHAGSWFQSSGPSAIEDSLIRWLAEKAGLPGTAGGSFCSGGSMANLTGLMVARDQKLGLEELSRGVVYISDQTHLSIAKSLRVLGFKPSQLRKVRSENDFKIDVDDLRSQIQADRSKGLQPAIIIATCGTTNTGTIDPLNSIADIASQENLWLHVDGAYGASIVLSATHAHLATGLGRADSISWDAHKWLFQTYGCGMILVKDKKYLLESFCTNADYVRDAAYTEEEPNFWNLGLELTRPARAMRLWFSLRVLGIRK